MADLYIKEIRYFGVNRKSRRRLRFKLSNGAKPEAVPCYEGWEIYNATKQEILTVMDAVEFHNEWLHGGELPWEGVADG